MPTPSNSVARFLIGGLAGYIYERIKNPKLKGAFPGVPFRPIYGVGSCLASSDYSKNVAMSMALEQLGHTRNKRKLWAYPVDNVVCYSEAVDPRNNVLFGVAMSTADTIFKALGI